MKFYDTKEHFFLNQNFELPAPLWIGGLKDRASRPLLHHLFLSSLLGYDQVDQVETIAIVMISVISALFIDRNTQTQIL